MCFNATTLAKILKGVNDFKIFDIPIWKQLKYVETHLDASFQWHWVFNIFEY